MRMRSVALLVLAGAVALAPASWADSINFAFNGSGISAVGTLTLGSAQTVVGLTSPSATALQITGISGTFSDSNVAGFGTRTITGLYSPSYVATIPGEASTSGGATYDDLFYPSADAPDICPGYPFYGGQLDILGLAFNLSGTEGYVGSLWSNGDVGFGPVAYAAGVSDAAGAVDFPNFGVEGSIPGQPGTFTTPEPSTLILFGFGALLLGFMVVKERNGKLHDLLSRSA